MVVDCCSCGDSGKTSSMSCESSLTAVRVTEADLDGKTSSPTYDDVMVWSPTDNGVQVTDAVPSFQAAKPAKVPSASTRIPPDGTKVDDVDAVAVTVTASPGCSVES